MTANAKRRERAGYRAVVAGLVVTLMLGVASPARAFFGIPGIPTLTLDLTNLAQNVRQVAEMIYQGRVLAQQLNTLRDQGRHFSVWEWLGWTTTTANASMDLASSSRTFVQKNERLAAVFSRAFPATPAGLAGFADRTDRAGMMLDASGELLNSLGVHSQGIYASRAALGSLTQLSRRATSQAELAQASAGMQGLAVDATLQAAEANKNLAQQQVSQSMYEVNRDRAQDSMEVMIARRAAARRDSINTYLEAARERPSLRTPQ